MTIFDSNPFQINSNTKSIFCDNYKFTSWSFREPEKYKNKIKIKKKVTFADDNGQDLIHVLVIDNSKFPDLKYSSIYEQANNQISTQKFDDKMSISTQPYDWVTSFIQPASVYSRFKSELGKQKLKLATAVINKHSSEPDVFEFEMTGIIKIVNLCYHKRAFVRLSSDSAWTTFSDIEAKYKNSSSEFLHDTNAICDVDDFEFHISLPLIQVNEPTYLEFVIGLETPECGSYWDNNNGKNYRIDYCQIAVDKFSSGFSTPNPYTHDYKPNMQPFQSGFTGYRVWNHFSEEANFY